MATPLFIITKTRTGSTLLQRLLNSYEDTIIWGEHGGFLKGVVDLYAQIRQNKGLNRFVFERQKPSSIRSSEELQELIDPGRWQAWINWFGLQDITCIFRNMVLGFFRPSLVDGHRYWGFKETRYAHDRIVPFLSELFPEAIFIFLVRNSLNRAASKASAIYDVGVFGRVLLRLTRGPRFVKEAWHDRSDYRSMLNWHNSGQCRSYLLQYEDMIKGGPGLVQVLSHLGKAIGPRQLEVLAMKEGRGSNFDPGNNRLNERGQTIGWPWHAMAKLLLRKLNEELGYGAGSREPNAGRGVERVAPLMPLDRELALTEDSEPSRVGAGGN